MEKELQKMISLLKEMNNKMDIIVDELGEVKNLFIKYDMELEYYDEEIREG